MATPIGPEIEIVKLNNPTGPVTAGTALTYTLIVSNESNVAGTSVVVTDTVPTAVNYVSCSTPVGSCTSRCTPELIVPRRRS